MFERAASDSVGDIDTLLGQAARCRRLARAIGDGDASRILSELARDYEARAVAARDGVMTPA